MSQLSRKAQELEMQYLAQLKADAAKLTSIDDYRTASMYALERFAKLGDALAQREINRRRNPRRTSTKI